MQVLTIEVPALGNRCHLVHDGRSALVVDPPRDLAAVERAAEEAGVAITAVADTHVHNDYLSGALGLARRHGADYLLAAGERVAFERVGVRDGDVVDVGNLEVRVIATPGHTRHHLSFLACDPAGGPAALFSGGSLLQGTVGRTDLTDDRLTHDLARAQWASARALAELDPGTTLHPTHGFGSFCASTTVPTSACLGTLADQLSTNPALITPREQFVTDLVAGFGPVPAYYEHMAPLNRAGAGRSAPRSARAVTADDVTDAILAGSWVVDLRDRSAFADRHLAGTVSVEYGAQFATYVGWLVPWQDDIVLLADSPTVLEPALRDLAGIGIDGVGTHVLRADAVLRASYRRSDWAGFRAADPRVPRVVIDVRRADEWAQGHLASAVHLALHELEARAGEIPAGEVWVHCRSGYRAGIAASILHRLGRDVVHVDDTWERVGELAIPTSRLAA